MYILKDTILIRGLTYFKFEKIAQMSAWFLFYFQSDSHEQQVLNALTVKLYTTHSTQHC